MQRLATRLNKMTEQVRHDTGPDMENDRGHAPRSS